jgi:Site-specific recombinase XerD
MKSQNTYSNYSTTLDHFYAHYEKLTPDSLVSYIELLKDKGNSTNTICGKLVTIRCFLNFCTVKGHAEGVPEMISLIRSVKPKEIIQEYATEQQAKATIDAMKKSSHKAIVALMYYGGLRLSETLTLTKDCLRDNGIVIRNPKNGCDRFVPYLSKHLKSVLEDHIQRTRPTDRLFPSVVQNSFQRVLRHTLVRIGYPKLHAHSFRHGLIVRLLENNLDVATISSISGHRSLSSLQKYFHISKAMLEKTSKVFT